MELNTLGAPSLRLLGEQHTPSAGPSVAVDQHIKIERVRTFETVITASLAVGAIASSTFLFYFFIQTWMQETQYRAWLLLFCVPTLSYGLQKVWHRVLLAWRYSGTIQVEIDSVRASTLFNAVADRIDQVAESSGETCSCDVQGLTQYDKTLGRTQVRM